MRSSSSALSPAAAVAALFSVATAVLALVGWATDIPELRGIAPGLVSMNPLTAICFLLAAFALWAIGQSCPRRVVRELGSASALLIAVVGAVRLAGILSVHDLALDLMLFSERLAASGQLPLNRMAPNTAVSFVILGAALFVLRFERTGRRWWSQAIALVAFLLSFPAILG